MGQAVTLLFAVLLLGGGPIADQPADATEEIHVEANVSTIGTESTLNGTHLNGSSSSSMPSPTDPNTTTRANATIGDEHVQVEAEPQEGEVDVTASPVDVNVRLADGQIVELSFTPPGAGDLVHDLQHAPADHGEAEVDPAAAQASSTADDESIGLAWTIAPATGLAAAAAVSQVTPFRRWLRRVIAGAPLAPLYSRISRDDVLDHDTREAIYELLGRRPGLSLEAICEELDLTRTTARHHVRKLEQANMIEHLKLGRARIHHHVGERDQALEEHLLANETRAAIHDATQRDALTITEIAKAIDANPGSVHFHLGKLEEAGLVATRDEDGRRYRAITSRDDPSVVFEPA